MQLFIVQNVDVENMANAIIASLYQVSDYQHEPPSPSRMQDINVYKFEVALSAFNLGDYCMLSVLILLFINYMYYTVCVIASSTTFLNFSVNLNTKRQRMDNFPEVINTAFLRTFIFCDSLDSLILIFLHWPSNPLTFKFNRFQIFISIPFHVTLYLFLICVITFIFDSIPSWIIFSRILLSGDVELNPGDKHFTFLNWNLNSLAKDNFGRAQLLEAHNSIFDYDLISICETSLDDTTEIPEVLIEDYTFVDCNNPNNTKHRGVGLFYKNNLPIKVRNDLSFDESIVV